MNNSVPAVALGHFVMKVRDINISYQFYTKLGLRPFGIFPESLMPLLPVRSTSCKGEAGGRRRCRGGIGMLRVGYADG
jgi:catechol 2,3-dioxygenase-like lactoylglutathione lyase family enzyme